MTETQPDPDISFEGTLISLQQIVEELELGNLPLAETVRKFELGTRLAAQAQTLLAEAELRITVLSDVEDMDDDDSDDSDVAPF